MSDRDAWTKHVAANKPRIRDRVPVPVVDRPSKYGARPMTVNGIRFDSTKEATRYQELKLLASAGAIVDLLLQPCFPVQVVELFRGGPPWVVTTVGVYTADFQYVETATGEVVVEDTKSDATKHTAYRLRKRLVEAIHGISIREL